MSVVCTEYQCSIVPHNLLLSVTITVSPNSAVCSSALCKISAPLTTTRDLTLYGLEAVRRMATKLYATKKKIEKFA